MSNLLYRIINPPVRALLQDGSPSPIDIERVIPQMVYLKFPLTR